MTRLPNHQHAKQRGQSFVEFVLVLPVLLLLLGGLVEVGVFINQYLNAIDLTREAARFASGLEAYGTPGDKDCLTTTDFNFYYDTSCIFSPPADPPGRCPYLIFCNGVNPYLPYKPDQDDVVITIITVIEDNNNDGSPPDPNQHIVYWPDDSINKPGWALSNNDDAGATSPDPGNAYTNNWQKDCKGNTIQTQNTFMPSDVQSFLNPAAPGTKGFVVVEYYYCYYQILHLPGFYQLIPNPIRMHTYTVMPAILPGRCMDKVDNDFAGGLSDGIDWPADPECIDKNDPNEDF